MKYPAVGGAFNVKNLYFNFCIRRRRDAKLLFFYGPTVLKKNRGKIKNLPAHCDNEVLNDVFAFCFLLFF